MNKKYDVIWLSLFLTNQCNANCSFCYVKKNDRKMTEIQLQQVVNYGHFLVENYRTEVIKLIFLGGEPLLALPEVETTITKAQDIPCQVDPILYTNGLVLTDNIMKNLRARNVTVVLSANHSTRDFILDKCETIKKYQPRIRVSITIDKNNLKRLPILTEALLDARVLPRYFVEYRSWACDNFVDEYILVMEKCFDIVNNYVKDPTQLVHLYEFFDPRAKGGKNPYVVGRNMFVFDPEGLVRTTTSLKTVGLLGYLGDNKDYLKEIQDYPARALNLPRWSAKDISECQNCEVKEVCQGGYPTSRYLKWGKFNKPTPYCRAFKHLVPKFIEMYEDTRGD